MTPFLACVDNELRHEGESVFGCRDIWPFKVSAQIQPDDNVRSQGVMDFGVVSAFPQSAPDNGIEDFFFVQTLGDSGENKTTGAPPTSSRK